MPLHLTGSTPAGTGRRSRAAPPIGKPIGNFPRKRGITLP